MPETNTPFENKLNQSDFGKLGEPPSLLPGPSKPISEMSLDEVSTSLKNQGSLILNKAVNPFTLELISPLRVDQTGRYDKQLVGWDNEDIYGSMQSNWDKAANGVLKSLTLAGTTFLQGTVGLVYGLGNVVAGNGASSFYNNDLSQYLDKLNKEAENYLPNYYTAKETNSEWYSTDNLLTANFLWDKLIKNAGFSLGAIYSGGVVSKVLSTAFKAVPLLSDAAQLNKVTKALEEVLPSVPAASRAAKFKEVLSSAIPKISGTAVDRTLTSLFGAATEGGIEALQGANEFRDSKIAEFQAKNFHMPDSEEMAQINKAADSLGNERLFMNIGLLSATNYIQLPRILGSRYSTSKAIANSEVAAAGQATGIRRTAEGTFERAVPRTKFGRGVLAAGSAASVVFSPTEAFEEGAQYVIQEGTKDYYNKKYGGEGASYLESLWNGAKQLPSKEGMESIILGGLSGGIQQSGILTLGRTGTIKERGLLGTGGTRGAATDKLVADLNSTASMKWFSDMQDAAARGINLIKEQEKYIRQGDILETKDKEMDLMHNYLAVRIKNGRYDLVKEDIATLKQQASTQQGLDKLIEQGIANENDDIASFNKRLLNFEQHADNLKPTFEALYLKYGGLVDGEGKKLYGEPVIDQMAYAVSKIADYDQRIPQLSQELVSKGIELAPILQSISEGNVGDTKEAISQIDVMQITVDEKASMKEALQDIMDMTNRRSHFLSEYNNLATTPELFKEADAIPDYTPETVSIKTKDGQEDIEVGTEYYLGNLIEEDEFGNTKTRFPKLTILGENEDGTIKIKDGNGQIRDIPKSVLEDYKLGKVSDVHKDENTDFYFRNIDKVKRTFFNFGKKRGGKQEGVLTLEGRKLYFTYKKGKTKTKMKVSLDMFSPKTGFQEGLLTFGGPLTAEDKANIKSRRESGKTAEDQRDRRGDRMKLIGELIDENNNKLESLRKKIFSKQEKIQKAAEDIADLATFTKKDKFGTVIPVPFNKVLQKSLQGLSTLTSLKQSLEKEVEELKAYQEELEFNAEYFADLVQNIDELPTNSKEFLQELKDQYEEVINTSLMVGNQISVFSKMIEDIKAILKELASFLQSAFSKFDREYPDEIRNSLKDDEEVFKSPQDLKNYIADYTLIKDVKKEINLNEEKIQPIADKIQELYKELSKLEKEASARWAILDKFTKAAEQYRQQEKEKQEFLKDIELQKLFFSVTKKWEEEDGSSLSPEEAEKEQEEYADKREKARKPASILFNATTTPAVLERPSDIRHQNFLTKISLFPNRNNIRRTFVTTNNEEALKLTGLIESHLGSQYEEYKDELILAIYVEVTPEGTFYVDENGKQVGKIGEPIVDKGSLIYAAMPSTSLEDSFGKRYSGEEEEAKAWQEAWRIKREKLLSFTDSYAEPEEFNVSRGLPIKSDKKEYIVGNLVSEEQLRDGESVLVVSTEGKIQHQGKSITIPAGSVMIQNGATLEYANNRNLTDKEAEAVYNVIKEFARKAKEEKTLDAKLSFFLRGILFFSSPYTKTGEKQEKPVGRNQMYLHQGSLFLGEEEYRIPFTPASIEANKAELMAFLRGAYNHVNNALLKNPILSKQPFIEYTGNLEEKEWPNYQTYLLSKEGRSPEEVPLSTNVRPIDPSIPNDRNYNNRYSYANTIKEEDVAYEKKTEAAVSTSVAAIEEGDAWSEVMAAISANMQNEQGSTFKLGTETTEEAPIMSGVEIPFSEIFGTTPEETTKEEKDSAVEAFKKMQEAFLKQNPDLTSDESQFRIALPSREYTLAKIDEEEEYIKKNSPFSVKVVKNLVNSANGAALWGAYKNAIIYLDAAMEEGTGYHELFEGIFDVFLSASEKARIYKEFVSRKGSFIDRTTGKEVKYSEASPFQAKEQMAEEFRAFKLYGEISSEIPSETSSLLKLFQDLINWIKSIFTGEINSLDELFSRMDSAYYKNVAFKNAPTPYLQAREKIGEFDSIQTDTVVRAVVSSVFQELFEEGNTKLINDLDFGSKVPKEVYNRIYRKLQRYYLIDAPKELKEQGLTDNEIAEKLLTITASLFGNWQTIVKYSGELLKTFKILQEEGEIDKEGEESSFQSRGDESYLKEAFEWDGKKNAPASVKLLIATLQESIFAATDGTIKVGSENKLKKVVSLRDQSTRMHKMVNYANTFNALLDQLSSLNTLDQKERKLRELANTYPEYVRLVSRLRTESSGIQEWHLRIKFYNTFSKQKPLALNTYLTPEGTSVIGAADIDSAVKQLSNNWLSVLKTNEAVSHKEGKYFLNLEYKKGNAFIFPTSGNNLASKMKYLEAFGIKFSPQQVANITPSELALLQAAINTMSNKLKGKSVNITTLRNLDINGPLTDIFKIFLRTDNIVPSSVFAGLDGNYRQTFVQTNAISRVTNDLNNAKTLEEAIKELPHLGLPYSSDSYYLSNAAFNSEGKRLDFKFFVKYIQGIVSPNGDKNIPTDKLSKARKLAQAINQNLNENYYVLIPADSKTEWMVGMKNPFLSLSEGALKQFYSYYQNEQSLPGKSADRTFKIFGDGLSEEQFNDKLKKFVAMEVEEQFEELKDHNIITNVSGGKYKWEGLDETFLKSRNLSHENLSPKDVNDILEYRTVNFMFNNIELHKLFFGDPVFYKDFKRFKSFLSPREQALYGSQQFNAVANKEYNVVAGETLKKGDPGYLEYKDFLRTATLEDVISTNDLKGYAEVKGTDAYAFTTPAAYRQMRVKTGRWNSLDDRQLEYINAEDRYLMSQDGKYTYTSKTLEAHDKALVEKGDPKLSRMSPLKPIVSGFDEAGPILDKYSITMLSYRAVRGTNMASQYVRMIDNQMDYLIFESGRKVGARKKESVYNAEGAPNTSKFSPDSIINVPFKWWGIQVETQSDKNSQTWGSQLGKLGTVNLMSNGVPVDFNGTIEQWNNLSEEKKLESPIYKLVTKERKLREKMLDDGYERLLDAVGINKDGTVSKAKLLSLIKDELTRRELNDNIKDALQIKEDGDFLIPLEALNNYEQIKNIIYSYIDKYISRPKVSGGSKIQTSGVGMEVAGKRIVAKKIKDKVIYTSTGLHFYTKEKPWCGIMIGAWFSKELRKIPSLKNATDKELLDFINNSPEGKEILSGIGFRIPSQELNSIENFRIEAFLPDYLGDMVVVPEAITTKSGGDFDVDKLNTYLKNVYVNGKGELKLVPYFEDKAEGDKFFENEAFEVMQRDLDFVDKKKEKLFNIRETFAELAYGAPTDEFKEKWTEIISDMFEDEIEDLQGQDRIIAIEEVFIRQMETLGKKEKELTEWDTQEILRDKFMKRMYKQSLENEYYRTLDKLLSLPQNFDRLVAPNSSDELTSLRDMLAELVPSQFGQGEYPSILSPIFMNNLRHMYNEGKGGVGIAASAQVQNAVAQKSIVIIDPSRKNILKDKNERKHIGNASVLLPSNTIEKDGKKFATISSILDKSKRYISDKISQFINGFVDIANDPFLVQLGVTRNNAGMFLLLERLGVPTNITVLFMNQPIIREYAKLLERSGMSYPYIQDNIDEIKKQFPASEKLIPTNFPEKNLAEYLKNNISDFYNKTLTEEQKAFQHFVLAEYLKYAVMAQNLFRLGQATNFDTARFTNPYLILRKLVQLKEAKENNIFSSADDIVKNVFVDKLKSLVTDASTKISESFFKFLHPSIQPYVFPVMYKLTSRKKMNDAEFVKASRKVEQSFITYLIQNSTKLNQQLRYLLVDEATSLAKELREKKAELNALKINPFPIISQFLIENISSPEATKTIKMFKKETDVFSQNTLIAAMQELKENPATSALYGKLVRVAFLQSGIAKTPISFLDIVPVEDFKALVYPAIKSLYDKDLLKGFIKTDSFFRNSWKDPLIAPRIPLKYSDREEDMVFDPYYGDFVPSKTNIKNRYENNSLSDYAKSRGIDNFVVFKVSEMSNIFSSDFATVQLGEKESKKTYLLKKLIDPSTNEPFTQPYTNYKGEVIDPENRYGLYYQINPLGDGYKAQEHYDTIRRSVLTDTEAASIPVELSAAEIVGAIVGKNLVVPDNVVSLPMQNTQTWIVRPKKIIAGGQTGGDLGGLEGAKEIGIETGGTAPPNFISGNKSEKALLESYGLVEGEPDNSTYVKRTIKNVQDSDGTVAILWGSSVGTGKTIGYAQNKVWAYGDNKSKDTGYKPVLVITSKDVKIAAQELRDFVSRNNIQVLNIAGHRETSQKGIQAFTKAVIIEAFGKQSAPTEEDFEAFKNQLPRKDCK